MITLRCTQKLLDRLAVPRSAASDAVPDNALGNWYANLVRYGRDQLVIAISERSLLAVVLPARGVRDLLPRDFPRTLGMLLHELEVPDEVIGREIAAMQPVTYARTASRSALAALNERVRMAEFAWRDGESPMDVMLRLARMPILSGRAHADYCASRAARRLLGLDPRPPAAENVVRLHVILRDLSPPIWRRIVVPDTITLPKLHMALQLAMGWQNCHLHEFDFGGAHYGMPDEDHPEEGPPDEDGIRLRDVLRAKSVERFTYVYDFGDHWQHDVRIEAVERNADGLRGVVCLEGANRCPPEDVGGTSGYMDFLQALRDPAHEGHADMVRWIGGRDFDPSAFELDIVNARLRVEFDE